jgi:hypothetical protein
MQTGIEAQAVEHPDQVGQFGVVEVHLQGADSGLATAKHQTMLTWTRRGNFDRLGSRPKGSGDPTHQITGVGQHHVDQRRQVIALTLQRRAARPIQGPAGDDAQRIRGMARRNIWEAFQLQAAALLPVNKGLFHGALGSGHHIHQAGPQPLKATRSSPKG